MLDALAKMRNLGGFTVTIPHKTAILPLLGRITKRAQASGSVNLVKRDTDGVLSGDIVDGVGFVKRPRSAWAMRARRQRLAGRAWAAPAARSPRRSAKQASAACWSPSSTMRAPMPLSTACRSIYPDVPAAAVDAPPKGIHYAINATPLGLKPGDPLSFDPMQLDADVLVAEVIMSPVETPLLQRARTHGRRIHHGRHMLDHQVPLYLEWFGIDAKGVDVVALARSIV